MKKIFLLICFLSFSIAQAAVDANLKGTLQLKGKAKSSESFLDLLKCGLEELPKKFLRKENITASYKGGTKVTLEQDVADDAEKKFLLSFRVPSILRVASTKKVKKETVKSGTVGVECAVAAEEVNNSGSSGENFSSSTSRVIKKHHLKAKKLKRNKLQRKQNKTKKFLRSGSAGLTFSVKKLVAVRKGNKGRVIGTFVRKQDKALGRFVVNFDYNETQN
jgi:hypothetical protein